MSRRIITESGIAVLPMRSAGRLPPVRQAAESSNAATKAQRTKTNFTGTVGTKLKFIVSYPCAGNGTSFDHQSRAIGAYDTPFSFDAIARGFDASVVEARLDNGGRAGGR
jgi:hypothetical protein